MKQREYNKLVKRLNEVETFSECELREFIKYSIRLDKLIETSWLILYKNFIPKYDFIDFMNWLNSMGYLYYTTDMKFLGKSELTRKYNESINKI